ncbi:hypothetical protein SprV_0200729000 [Sparganum proliferum]
MRFLLLFGLVCALVAVAAGYPNHEHLDVDKWRWKKLSDGFASHSLRSSNSGGGHGQEVEKKTRQPSYSKHFHDWDQDHDAEQKEGAIVLFDRKANMESHKSFGRGYHSKTRGSKSGGKKSLIAKASMSYASGPFGMPGDDDFGDFGFRDGYDHRRRHDKYSHFGGGFRDLTHEASRRAHRPRMEFDFDYDDFDRGYDDYYEPFFDDSQYPNYDFDDFYYPNQRFYHDHWADYDFPYEDDYYPYYGGYEPEEYYGGLYDDYDFPEYELDRHYGRFVNHHDFGHPFHRMRY